MSHPRPPDDSATLRADAAASTPSGDSVPTAFDPNITAMLGPPQRADELGRLGDYRVLRVLGRGGMGAVFEAEDLRLGRRVALKVMLPSLATQAQARDRFTREARAAAAVEHDHIVPIYQVGEDRNVPFLAMPLLHGETLDDRLKREGTIPVPELVVIGRQLADGLAAAHAKELVHRDVKPSNIWLERTEEGTIRRARLLDFGLARPRDDDTAITGSGAVLGTPAYMSPEQARSESVDQRSDLFSLGSVLYQMATGRRPFRGKDTFAILTSLAVDTPAAPATVNPAVPPALSDLILRMLAKDPAGRPQTAKEVSGELVQIGTALTLADVEPGAANSANAFAEIDEPTEAVSAAPKARRPAGRQPLILTVGLAAGGLAVLLAVALIWRATRPTTQPPADSPNWVVTEPGKKEPQKSEPTKSESVKKTPPADPSFFNQKDLAGWTGFGAQWRWNPEISELTAGWANPSVRPGPATLASDREYRDFELSFRVDIGVPAGHKTAGYPSAAVYFRAAPAAGRPGGWSGPMLRLGPGQWGKVSDDRAAVVADPPPDPALDKLVESTRLPAVTLKVAGKHVTVTVNGTETTNAEFPDLPASGRIVWYLGTPPDGLAVRDIRFTDRASPAAAPIDLLARIDPAKDTVAGAWERTPAGLAGRRHGDGGAVPRVEVPYRPPAEYDVTAEFTRTTGDAAVGLTLTRGGRPFAWSLSLAGTGYGFRLVDGQELRYETPATQKARVNTGTRHVTRVEVRKDRLTGYLDGEKIAEVRTDGSNLTVPDNDRLRDDALLGLVCSPGVTVTFHRVEVVEVTGKGAFTRAGPAEPAFFNGKDLAGWDNWRKDGSWAVPNGEIVCTRPAGNKGPLGLKSTTPAPADFEVAFEVKAEGDVGNFLHFRQDAEKTATSGILWLNRFPGRLQANKAGTWADAAPGFERVKPGPDGYIAFTFRVVGSKVTVTAGDGPARETTMPDLPAAGTLEWHVAPGCERLRVRNLRITNLTKPRE